MAIGAIPKAGEVWKNKFTGNLSVVWRSFRRTTSSLSTPRIRLVTWREGLI